MRAKTAYAFAPSSPLSTPTRCRRNSMSCGTGGRDGCEKYRGSNSKATGKSLSGLSRAPAKLPACSPILAARFSSALLVAPGLTDAQRSGLIQQLVRLALANRTALDTVLARLLLSARNTKFEMPTVLDTLEVPGAAALAGSAERLGVG